MDIQPTEFECVIRELGLDEWYKPKRLTTFLVVLLTTLTPNLLYLLFILLGYTDNGVLYRLVGGMIAILGMIGTLTGMFFVPLDWRLMKERRPWDPIEKHIHQDCQDLSVSWGEDLGTPTVTNVGPLTTYRWDKWAHVQIQEGALISAELIGRGILYVESHRGLLFYTNNK